MKDKKTKIIAIAITCILTILIIVIALINNNSKNTSEKVLTTTTTVGSTLVTESVSETTAAQETESQTKSESESSSDSDNSSTQNNAISFEGNYIGVDNPNDTMTVTADSNVTITTEKYGVITGTTKNQKGKLIINGVASEDQTVITFNGVEENGNLILTCTDSSYTEISVNDTIIFGKIIEPIVLSSSYCDMAQPYMLETTNSDGEKKSVAVYHTFDIDLDGDGKKDTITLTGGEDLDVPEDSTSQFWIADLSINGKSLISERVENTSISIGAYIYKINGENLICVTTKLANSFSNYDGTFYRYKNGKLKKAYKEFSCPPSDSVVTNNVILASRYAEFSSIGSTTWKMAYKLNNSTWKAMWDEVATDYSQHTPQLTLTKDFSVSLAPNNISNSTTLPKGSVVQVKNIVETSSGTTWICIEMTNDEGVTQNYYYIDEDIYTSDKLYGLFEEAVDNFSEF